MVLLLPYPNKVYANKNGIKYICLTSNNRYEAVFQAINKTKWTFTAHGCQIYDNGEIEWMHSTNGRFAE